MKNDTSKLVGLSKDIEFIKGEVVEIKARLDNQYVTRAEFLIRAEQLNSRIDPIQKIVYGLISLILAGVIGALLSLVLRK